MNASIEQVKQAMMKALARKADELQLTQKEVAVYLGTTQPRVSNIFQGHSDKFSLDSLYGFMDNLGIEAEFVIDGSYQRAK